MRIRRVVALIGLLSTAVVRMDGIAAPPSGDERPLLTTGITGRAAGTGLEDPQFVLSFLPVQRLVLAATVGPVERSEAEKLLAGTPVTVETLVRLGLLSQEGRSCRLAYTVLTVEDQERIFAVSRELGRDLADRFQERKTEFDRLLKLYPRQDLRQELAFGLVAGMVLNWEGLEQATRLGLRTDPDALRHGGSFLVHSEEIGAEAPAEGLYSGSHTFPGPRISLSTFGDGPSIPRKKGLPDALAEPVERGLAVLDDVPSLRGAAQQVLVLHLIEALVDAGAVLDALKAETLSEEELASRVDVAPERLSATVELLTATGYVTMAGDGYTLAVPMLTARDKELVDGVLRLGSEVIVEWLQTNGDRLQDRFKDLTPLRNGLPFETVFNEVWHYTFGWTTRFLAEEGFYQDPRAGDYSRRGYVPLVWESSLYSSD